MSDNRTEVTSDITNPIETPTQVVEGNTPEDEAIQRLLEGREATVYHILANPDDLLPMQQGKFTSNFKVRDPETKTPMLRPDGRPVYLIYFLLSLRGVNVDEVKGKIAKLTLNKENSGEHLKILDNRSHGNERERGRKMVIEGNAHGQIREAGAIVPSVQKYELSLHDGIEFAKRLELYTEDEVLKV